MSWIAVAIAAGAVIQGVSSQQASQAQKSSASDAIKAQMAMYGQMRQDLGPWMVGGQMALGGLEQYMGLGGPGGWNPNAPGVKPFTLQDFQASPAYQFNLQQGQLALDKAATARGNYYAPQTLQDVSRFSQGLASNEFWNQYNAYQQQQQNVYNRLQGMSALGESAAAGVGAGGVQTGQGVGQTMLYGGASQAAGIMGIGNALQGGIGNAYNAYLMQQILAQQNAPTSGPSGLPGGLDMPMPSA